MYAPEKTDPSALQSDGMVVFSTGLPEQCNFGPYVNLHFWSNNGTSTFAQVNNPILKSDFADHFGYVNALTLKPGRYDIFPDAQPGLNMNNIPHAFVTIGAGKIVYIGEYFIDFSCASLTTRHERIVSHFFDKFDRDVAVLRAKNPAFGKVVIEKHVVHFEVVTPN
ncbi:MAG: hypothetical protein ABSD74_15660 [Rhizomicrobium sp.]